MQTRDGTHPPSEAGCPKRRTAHRRDVSLAARLSTVGSTAEETAEKPFLSYEMVFRILNTTQMRCHRAPGRGIMRDAFPPPGKPRQPRDSGRGGREEQNFRLRRMDSPRGRGGNFRRINAESAAKFRAKKIRRL